MQPLRDYQSAAIALLRLTWRERPILCAPTGSGKTTIAAHMIHSATIKGKRVLFLAHRKELIQQAHDRLWEHGVDSGIIQAGLQTAPMMSVQVASVQTLVRREPPPADIVIVDECHHARASTYEKILAWYPDAAWIGLTATPFRLDGKGLGGCGFNKIVTVASPAELIRRGHLLQPRYFVSPVNLSGIATVAGEFHQGQLAETMDTGELVGNIVDQWNLHAAGRRTVCFASSVQHSRNIALRFGDQAAHIDGETPMFERDRILAQLRAGEIKIVTNYGILTEGWDLPSAAVCVLARPTKSLGLYLQMVGRIMRPASGKEQPLVLDHAGCIDMHGLPTDEIEYSLTDKIKKSENVKPIKYCKACFAVNNASAKVCVVCGAEFVVEEREEKTEGSETLVELVRDQNRDYVRWLQQASRCAYKVGWARFQFKKRYHAWPRLFALERQHYKPMENMDATAIAAEIGDDRFREIADVEPFRATWSQVCLVAATIARERSRVWGATW